MPNGLNEVALAAEDAGFRRRVKAALFRLSIEMVVNAPDNATQFHRFGLAKKIGADPGAYVEPFAWLCASNSAVRDTVIVEETGAITVAVDDAILIGICQDYWDTIAQVPSLVGG